VGAIGAEIHQLIQQCEFSETQVFGNIAVTGLMNSDAPRYGDILSMSISMELSELQVTETGNVPHLFFSSHRPTLIRVGEAVLEGGRQDRIVRRSAIIDGHTNVNVFCIEAGRWAPRNQNWTRIDTPVSLRQLVLSGADQNEVWVKVSATLNRWNVRSNTKALGSIYEELTSRFQKRASKFKFHQHQVGMLVTVDGVVRGAEYFGDRMAFSRDAPGILSNSYIPEAREDVSGHMAVSDVQESISEFLGDLKSGKRYCDLVRQKDDVVYACAV
jgi:hypothetical protein